MLLILIALNVNMETELFLFLNDDNTVEKKNEANIINDDSEHDQKSSIKMNSSTEGKKKTKEEKMKRKNIKKLNLLDNNYFEQIDILQSTLGGI